MAAPSTQDLNAPFDPTAFTTITGAQLLELIAGATPFGDKGLIMSSTDIAGVAQVPNAGVLTKWKNYMWIRISATFVTAYIWNPNGASDATFLNWVTLSSASIGPATIQGYQIAAATITSNNILSIASTLITGSVVPAWLASLNIGQTAYVTNGIIQANSPLFGDLGGSGSTLASPVIANGAINAQKLTLQSINGSETLGAGIIKDNTVTKAQILNNGQGNSTAFLDAGVDPSNNIILPTTSIIGLPAGGSSTQASVAGDVLGINANRNGYVTIFRALLALADPAGVATERVLRVASGATAYSLANPQGNSSYGRLLQVQSAFDKTAASTADTCSDATAPTTSNCALQASLTCAITPISSTSTIEVEMCLYLSNGAANTAMIAALFQDANANAIAAASTITPTTTHVMPVILRYSVANLTAGIPTTFKAAISGSANTTRYNSVDGTTVMFGGTLGVKSYIRVTEIL